jgi:FtsP/CotA-like multicopper oxidase with cupredoxin domain
MTHFTRRHFISSLAAAAAAGPFARPGAARADETGIVATTRVLEVKGRAAKVFALETRHGFVFDAGQAIRLRLSNRLGEPTLVHWHGQTPPSDQDGVPMLSQPVLQPGQSYAYEFEPRPGTHWMHSHVGLQEQKLLAAPMIFRDKASLAADMQEHVVLLHDFTFRDPEEILAELQAGGHAAHGSGGHAAHGGGAGNMGAEMATPAPMLNDVAFDAFLANDRTLDDPEILRAEVGGRVRLRIINGAAASNMWVDTGRLEARLVAVDGNTIVPLAAKLFPLAIAQRIDLAIDLPRESGAWPVLFRPEGTAQRTGILIAAGEGRIAKIAGEGERAPALDLAMELEMRAERSLRPEPVTRTEMLMLTGGGADYVWGLNGKPAMHATLFGVRPGERIAVMMHNMTPMAHPMHLHGHHFQVIDIGGQRIAGAVRDTVLVPPMGTVTIAFDADNPGNWAFHCHHLYHMNAGMMGAVAYVNAA